MVCGSKWRVREDYLYHYSDSMRVYYQIAHYDQRHRLKWKSALVKSDSFVKQFLQMLFSIMSRVSTNAIDISNTSRTLTTSSAALEQQISVSVLEVLEISIALVETRD